jgi:hypothetical protein
MNGLVLPCLALLVVFLLVPIVLSLFVRKHRTAWQEVAERTGLASTPAGWLGLYGWEQVHGLYRGRALRLYSYGDSTMGSLVEDTKIAVAVRNAGDAYFSLSPPMLAGVAKRFPPKEWVLLGDAAFDEGFLLRGRPAGFVAAVLAPAELRQRLLHLRSGTGLVLMGQEIKLQRHGLERDVEYLHFVFDLLCDLAERVEGVARASGEDVGAGC